MKLEYTAQAEEVLQIARKLAKELGHPYIGTEHLLLGVRNVFTGVGAQVLEMNRIREDNIKTLMLELISTEKGTGRKLEYTPRLQQMLYQSKKEAIKLRSRKIGTEHFLIAIVKDYESVAARVLSTLGANLQKIYTDILASLGENPQDYALDMEDKTSDSFLDKFSVDLTQQASDGKLDPVLGREEEITRLMQILSRRTKNNPCLIGEPGVGKTAIVEGLAQNIVTGMVPNVMKSKRVISLDLSSMIAGTKFRGEFEERMKKMIQEVEKDDDIILFIDEIHSIIGAGGSEGTLDAANILKPSLARGTMQLIGATTVGEYRKYIGKDPALERRLQPIPVEEPSLEQCAQILQGLSKHYELHHDVQISDEAIHAAVELSERYITDRFLPDKAIDVLDEACSRVSLRGFKIPVRIHKLEEEAKVAYQKMEEALKVNDFEATARYRKEQKEISQKILEAKKRFNKKNENTSLEVLELDIADVVSAWTKIPVSKLSEKENMRLRKLEVTLHKRVIGQEEAVTAVAKAVKRGRIGLKDPQKPTGTFLFLGPTGVGKTELSKALAEILFGREDAMIRIDMSEYMEKHSVSKLIGSPPGYVGHEEGGQLSEKVRRNPYSVILFDEIEKAHPDVFNILLQVLDDGHITDSQGRKVDFKNTVIIMTSNAGAQAIIEPKKLGFAAKENDATDYKRMKSNVMDEVKRIFKPEFLNRIDDIMVFHMLGKVELKKIVTLLCNEFVQRVQNQMKITLHVRESLKKHIVEKGTDVKYGARPLKRALQNELEDKLADAILNGEITEGMEVDVAYVRGEVIFTEAKK